MTGNKRPRPKRSRVRIDVLTIFPAMFAGVLRHAIVKRAQEKGALEVRLHNVRDYTHDRRRTVDDRPYGGGPGMVLKPEPIFEAMDDVTGASRALARRRVVVLLAPQGELLTQRIVQELAAASQLVLICGRYEGVDERVREQLVDREISIGDYVLTGGELPAMVIIDAVARLLPGVLGHADSSRTESFSDGLLEYPQYTRPTSYRGQRVPKVLLSGDHPRIETWRKLHAIARTAARRPDLLEEPAP